MERAKKINAHRAGLSGPKRRGRKCKDLRLRVEGILWILRTGVGWRDLPAKFGPYSTVFSCFRSWSSNGLWSAILHALRTKADNEYLMIDSTSVRVHQHGSGPAGGQLAQAMARSRAGLSTKLHFACDGLGYPLGFIVTAANVHDYHQAKPLLQKYLTTSAHVLMDKGYDGDSIRVYVSQLGGIPVIAVNSRRSAKPAFDQHLYRERHRIENLFARLKHYRRISTRYEKLCSHFSSMVALASILIWLKL